MKAYTVKKVGCTACNFIRIQMGKVAFSYNQRKMSPEEAAKIVKDKFGVIVDITDLRVK